MPIGYESKTGSIAANATSLKQDYGILDIAKDMSEKQVADNDAKVAAAKAKQAELEEENSIVENIQAATKLQSDGAKALSRNTDDPDSEEDDLIFRGEKVDFEGVEALGDRPRRKDYLDKKEYREDRKVWKSGKRDYLRGRNDEVEVEAENASKDIAKGIKFNEIPRRIQKKILKKAGQAAQDAPAFMQELEGAITGRQVSRFTNKNTRDFIEAVKSNPNGVAGIQTIIGRDGSTMRKVYNPLTDSYASLDSERGLGKIEHVMLPGELNAELENIKKTSYPGDELGNAKAFNDLMSVPEKAARFNEFLSNNIAPEALADKFPSKDTNKDGAIDARELQNFSTEDMWSWYSGYQNGVEREAGITEIKPTVDRVLAVTNELKKLEKGDTDNVSILTTQLVQLLGGDFNVDYEGKGIILVTPLDKDGVTTNADARKYNLNTIDGIRELSEEHADELKLSQELKDAVGPYLSKRKSTRETKKANDAAGPVNQFTNEVANTPVIPEAIVAEGSNSISGPVNLQEYTSTSGKTNLTYNSNGKNLFRGYFNPNALEQLGLKTDDIQQLQNVFDKANTDEFVPAKYNYASLFNSSHGFIPARLLDQNVSLKDKQAYYELVKDNKGLAREDNEAMFNPSSGLKTSWGKSDDSETTGTSVVSKSQEPALDWSDSRMNDYNQIANDEAGGRQGYDLSQQKKRYENKYGPLPQELTPFKSPQELRDSLTDASNATSQVNTTVSPDVSYDFKLKDGVNTEGADTDFLSSINNVAKNLPITVTSLFRTADENKAVGGVENSTHLDGNAADIRTRDLTGAQVIDTIQAFKKEGLYVLKESDHLHVATNPEALTAQIQSVGGDTSSKNYYEAVLRPFIFGEEGKYSEAGIGSGIGGSIKLALDNTKEVVSILSNTFFRNDESVITDGSADGADKDSVKAMQSTLNRLGYNVGTADGISGKKTEAGLAAYNADLKGDKVVAKQEDRLASEALYLNQFYYLTDKEKMLKKVAEVKAKDTIPEGYQYSKYVENVRKRKPSATTRGYQTKIDALNMTMGRDQEFNSFEESPYIPEEGFKGKTKRFFGRGTKYYRVKDSVKGFDPQKFLNQNSKFIEGDDESQAIKTWTKSDLKNKSIYGDLGNFTISKGEDDNGSYIALYDKNDYTGGALFGADKPFEIYDRIYYDPKTNKAIKQK